MPAAFQFASASATSAQAENFVAQPDQLRAERHADVTAADNQNTHEFTMYDYDFRQCSSQIVNRNLNRKCFSPSPPRSAGRAC